MTFSYLFIKLLENFSKRLYTKSTKGVWGVLREVLWRRCLMTVLQAVGSNNSVDSASVPELLEALAKQWRTSPYAVYRWYRRGTAVSETVPMGSDHLSTNQLVAALAERWDVSPGSLYRYLVAEEERRSNPKSAVRRVRHA